jgi:hypothetical protein
MISANCIGGRDRGNASPVLSARQFIGATTTALSLITGAFLLALAGHARAQGSAPACDAAGEIALLPSPRGVNLQALRAGGAAREDEQIPRLVPRAAPATAGVSGGCRSGRPRRDREKAMPDAWWRTRIW